MGVFADALLKATEKLLGINYDIPIFNGATGQESFMHAGVDETTGEFLIVSEDNGDATFAFSIQDPRAAAMLIERLKPLAAKGN